MNPEEFAAQRREQFERVDRELLPSTERALLRYARGEADWWSELLDDASVLWLETFEREAPNADPDRFIGRFREAAGEALDQTEAPTNPPDPGQVERVARWLGTFTVNEGTWAGAGARGIRQKRWTTMHDSDVRTTHVAVDGQVRPIGARFSVGGYELRFPGDPVGPPQIWINCRCLLQPAERRGAANVTATTFAIEEVDEDVVEDDEELITEIPVHGVLAPEGIPTGDGRQFAVDSLSTRTLPLPIAYQLLSGDGHSGSVTVGRIDEAWREGGEFRFRGAIMLNREHADTVIDGIIDGTVRGISVDVDNVEVDMSNEEDDGRGLTVFSSARVAGVTIVPIPAFQEAYMALGHEFAEDLEGLSPEEALAACGCDKGVGPEDDEPNAELGYDLIIDLTDLEPAELDAYFDMSPEDQDKFVEERGLAVTASAFAPGTKDGPGWITNPVATARIRRYWVHGKGAAKIRWGLGAPGGDFNRCRKQLAKYVQNPKWLAGLCANMHKEATGFWPGSRVNRAGRSALIAAGGSPAPIFNLVASANYTFDHTLFERPELANPRVGIVVDDNDRVYGYLAQWGVCHIGVSGMCTTAPPSQTEYWYYATGVVDTDKGEVRVGQITMDTGHAPMKANARVAAAHYDNTGAAVADVAIGEDAFGVWFSGMLRGKVTDEQRHALRASGRISGDWRKIGGNLELVAGLVVNVPGFPIPHAKAGVYNGEQVSLVAAGLNEEEPVHEVTMTMGPETVASIVRTAVQEYTAQVHRTERALPIREELKNKRVAALRARLGGN